MNSLHRPFHSRSQVAVAQVRTPSNLHAKGQEEHHAHETPPDALHNEMQLFTVLSGQAKGVGAPLSERDRALPRHGVLWCT